MIVEAMNANLVGMLVPSSVVIPPCPCSIKSLELLSKINKIPFFFE